jgi:hypothetical protein
MLVEELIWEAQPRQIDLITCPVEDVLYGGARGGGKTDGLLGDWATHAEDYGRYARGVFFRKSYPELEEVERRCHEIFPGFGAQWQATKRTWVWPNGASLRLRFLERDLDAEGFQGHSYDWVGCDELGNWPSSVGIDKLRACLRSAHRVPCFFRASANPGGVGHNWVKARYIDPAPAMMPFWAEETIANMTIRTQRCFIPATLDDNPILLYSDPGYWQRVVAAASGNEALVKAWRHGDWDIIAGGMLDDVWDAQWHVLEPFAVPTTWRIRRAFDWGSSKPFAVAWFAHADGETPAPNGRTYPKSTRVLLMEYYGWNGKPNEGLRMTNTEIARQIKMIEGASAYGGRLLPGPADSQIFDVVNGTSIADEMARQGVRWQAAQKGPGSRRQGAQLLRQRLKASMQWPMEEPGLFIFSSCRQWLRTVPVMPRDPKNPDDVDSEAEDHLYDCTRYELSIPLTTAGTMGLNF